MTRDVSGLQGVSGYKGYVLTSPPAPPSSPTVSLPPPAPAFSPPGSPVSLDGSLLAFPLLLLSDGMVLVLVLAPDDSSSLSERPSRVEQRAVLFPLQGICPGRAPLVLPMRRPYWSSPVGTGHAAGLLLSYDILRAYEYS